MSIQHDALVFLNSQGEDAEPRLPAQIRMAISISWMPILEPW